MMISVREDRKIPKIPFQKKKKQELMFIHNKHPLVAEQ